jgi:DNA-binding IclR family transcriptional regulator
VTNISVPILDAAGRPLAALTCPCLERLEGEASPTHDAILTLLLEAARDVSASAGVS